MSKSKAERRERREVKWALRKAVLKHHFRDYRFVATDAQLKASARIVADQLLAGRNPLQVVPLGEPYDNYNYNILDSYAT